MANKLTTEQLDAARQKVWSALVDVTMPDPVPSGGHVEQMGLL